ncbi:Fur family transcriptional regulator [Sphingomonas kyeonggiensis]|uniref:Fur family zinc uptake transcriptional regulator n=1 Tax=Sphingomonas kyeonggiensis TaxID=1268553 RepID=A0A7W6JWK1_9SPHN|nr:transcriptional repressor [Sphingomonas kyeonggiensis]MBB4100781.1 Fur family zinc uptake transcriptional regulator [Sphingomonas kyeonggiensis]
MSATGGCGTATTAMAETRRPAGQLNEAILRLLQDAGRPLRVVEIRARLERAGEAAAPSLIFRAIRQLAERGAIHKIEIARGYVAGDAARRIALLCRACGEVTLIECPEAFDALDALAERHGLATPKHMAEATGICARCREQVDHRPKVVAVGDRIVAPRLAEQAGSDAGN